MTVHWALRIQTEVSWNTAPPFGQPGSAEVSALMPMLVYWLNILLNNLKKESPLEEL